MQKVVCPFNDFERVVIIFEIYPTSPFSQTLRKHFDFPPYVPFLQRSRAFERKPFFSAPLMLVCSSRPVFSAQDCTGNYMQICWERGGSFTTSKPIEDQ